MLAGDHVMIAGLFRAMLRHDRAVVLGSLALVVLLAWIYLVFATDTAMPMMDMGGGQMMAMLPEWTLGYSFVIFVMWAVMMVAMMLPSAAPVTLLVSSVAQKRAAAGGAAHGNTTLFVFGYLAVWLAFAAAATTLQWALHRAGLLSERMAVGNVVFAGSVLVAAGVYQWTPLKEACLRRCRSPLDFLLFHWRDGARGAVASGIGHGLYCLGCCWMLMALLFVGGVMNLVWIAGIALLVLIEKTMPWGRRVSQVTGVVLVTWGAITLVTAAITVASRG
jgi:predicted metal-binding membrane protein